MKCYNEVEIQFDKKTKQTVFVQRFDDGSEARTPVDPKSEFFLSLKKMTNEENALARKHRYWVNASLDAFTYEGEIFADNNTPVTYMNIKEKEEVDITAFLDCLTETQRRRLNYRLKDPKITYREMAKQEGTSAAAICHTFDQLKELFQKFQLSTLTK